MRLKFIITFLSIFSFIIASKAQKDSIPDSKYYPAKGESKNVALILFGGSEGGLPNYYDVKKLTGLGYPCLILGYFGTKNTPDRLEMIPLEYFEKSINSFKSKPEIKNKKLVIWGGSKGGELVLLLASKNRQIEGVIAAVPSSVVFQGLGGNLVSSWSENEVSIPFVPFAPFDYSKIVNNQYVEVYKLSLEQAESVKSATIEVEKINGPILLLAGKEDSMWPSNQMCEMIIQRLKENSFPFWFKLYSYENAGHTLNDGYMMGGNVEGNKNARIDSEKRTIEFLNRLSESVN
jgi:dienelactone hydrolase